MRIEDLRATLNELADEAEDMTLQHRLSGIDALTRQRRRRRVIAGAVAAVVAMTVVGVGATLTDSWRTDSSDPIERPDGLSQARIDTVTDNGVTYQVDPGHARLIDHQVGPAADGALEFTVTPSADGIATESWCTRGSTDARYQLRLTIEGKLLTIADCTGAAPDQPVTPESFWEAPRWLPAGEPADVRAQLVDRYTGEPVADPSVTIGAAVYETTRDTTTAGGVALDKLVGFGDYNYRLVEPRLVEVAGGSVATFDLGGHDGRVFCQFGLVAPVGSNGYRARVLRGDEVGRRFVYAGGGVTATIVDAGEGIRLQVIPGSNVVDGTAFVAVYELAD